LCAPFLIAIATILIAIDTPFIGLFKDDKQILIFEVTAGFDIDFGSAVMF